jgi:septal ring factor EnvC (AmiA/AmiB activator)
MEAFLLFCGITQMAVGVIKPSLDAAISSKSIQDKIDEVNKETDDLKSRFKSLNDDIAKFDQALQDQITANVNNISQLHALIHVEQNNINSSQKQIQMFGIIFICFIFFALLIKEFDLLSGINFKIF